MKIKLKTMRLQNFKAVHEKEIDLKGKNAVISGANGTGKTTIYEAYYWCLFGKTLAPNGIVQTLDANNEIIHKIDTVVEVVLDINGEYEVNIRRALVEKWKAKNTPDEKFMGTEVQRYWNEVPVSMAEYKRKLADLVPIEQWQLLSNNLAFMAYKVEDRRKMLMSIAGEVDEEELMKPYPAIQEAVANRKTIEELDKQIKNTRKAADKELKEIPAKISAQDALKVDASADGIDDTQKVEDYFKALDNAQRTLDNVKRECQESIDQNLQSIRREMSVREEALRKATREQKDHTEEQMRRSEKLADITQKFNDKKAEWQKENDKQFDFQQSQNCPVCGRPLSEEFKREEYANAVAEYNKAKAERLEKIMREAQLLSQQKSVLTGASNAYKTIIKPKDDTAVETAQTALNDVQNDWEHDSKITIDAYDNYREALKKLEEIKAQCPANADDIVKIKANQEINQRVEREKERLQRRSSELSQIIADCDNVLYQIFNYKKTKIEAVESKVNGFFKLVTWKFFQQNITNDDLQEVCTCIVDGVDYNNLNTASKVNASLDIINGVSKATGISVPLYLDNRESTLMLIPSEQQIISLAVTNEQLTTKTL